MHFHPQEPFDTNSAQKYVWDSVKKAFADEPGVAYYRYPIFPRGRHRQTETDILLLHPALGLWCVECKGCRIDSIAKIEGHEWVMHNWHSECETPLGQAEDQMFAVKGRYQGRRETRDLLSFHYRVALPFVTRAQWQERGFDRLTGDVVLLKEDLHSGEIRGTLERGAKAFPQRPLTAEQWQAVTGVLRGELPGVPPRSIATGTPSDSPARVVRDVEAWLKILDEDQQKAAFEVPDGPQRLRGLAGAGKTVLLSKRAAKMHARHPEWRIAFVFFTKALYDHVRGLIECYHRDMTGEPPDWDRIQILHGWGGRWQAGYYHLMASSCGRTPLDLQTAKRKFGTGDPNELYDSLCRSLEGDGVSVPELFDAVLVDEGQDFPPSFYRLAHKSLKSPKRLYWAYDEAQGIGSLVVPKASAVFGEKDGRPLVDLSGKYEGGIDKSHIFRRCYRTPELLLMVAHAVNMGLLRREGPLQGITTQEDWQRLGYEVKGSFARLGETVRLLRSADARRHLVDVDEGLRKRAGTLLVLNAFRDEAGEREWIAEQTARDVQSGLRPDDILITGVVGEDDREHFDDLAKRLSGKGVKAWQPGLDISSTDFRRDGCVTVADVFRAKGNEAWKVYASRMHYATRPLTWRQETEVHKRNQAFVTLTRARIWCVATGLTDSPVLEEMRHAQSTAPELVFPAFNRASLKRVMDEAGQ